jgi:hypothetical protein
MCQEISKSFHTIYRRDDVVALIPVCGSDCAVKFDLSFKEFKEACLEFLTSDTEGTPNE